MSDKKLDAIKEIEFRISKIKSLCKDSIYFSDSSTLIDDIDTMLFDINDFINDLKDTNEAN